MSSLLDKVAVKRPDPATLARWIASALLAIPWTLGAIAAITVNIALFTWGAVLVGYETARR